MPWTRAHVVSLLDCSNPIHLSGNGLIHQSHGHTAAPRVQEGIEYKRVIRVQIRGTLVILLSSRSTLGNVGFREDEARSHEIAVI